MNIGLSYMTQIRGDDDTGQRTADDAPKPEDLSGGGAKKRALGGWIALTFNQLVASITSCYHRQHNADDSHSTITATGSISERSRTTPMGEWVNVPLLASRFSGSGAMTWTVPTTIANTGLSYMLVGKTMFVQFSFASTTVGGTPNTFLQIQVHDTLTPNSSKVPNSAFWYSDNGTRGIGQCQVVPNAAGAGVVVRLLTQTTANWSASATLTNIQGEMFFEVQ